MQQSASVRMKTSDEEVYEEGPPRALQTGVKEWLDGGKKRHAQAQVWCTSVTQNRSLCLLLGCWLARWWEWGGAAGCG